MFTQRSRPLRKRIGSILTYSKYSFLSTNISGQSSKGLGCHRSTLNTFRFYTKGVHLCVELINLLSRRLGNHRYNTMLWELYGAQRIGMPNYTHDQEFRWSEEDLGSLAAQLVTDVMRTNCQSKIVPSCGRSERICGRDTMIRCWPFSSHEHKSGFAW